MRTISSIQTAALVVARAATAPSQRAESRPPPSQDPTTMKAFGPGAVLRVIDRQEVDTERIADAAHAVADLEGRPS